MLEIYLIRHAESLMNEDASLIGGRSNHTPLSSKGRMQAEYLGKRLLEEKIIFDQAFSSIAFRARDTADIACRISGYPIENIIRSDQILELGQGDWEGKPRIEIYTEEMLKKINSNNWHAKAPNGESQKEVEERMYSFLENEILSRYDSKKDQKFGVFSHGMAIKCCLRKIMDFSPAITYKIAIDNTAITKLKYDYKGWHILAINDTSHLVS